MDHNIEQNLSKALKDFILASIRDAIGHASDDICEFASQVREASEMSAEEVADHLVLLAASWETGADDAFGQRT